MKQLLLPLLGGLVLALAGCGGPVTYTVSGKVTYNSEPLPEGYISFVPTEEGQGAGGQIKNGQYSVRAQAGKNRVQITASKLVPLPPGQVGMYGKTEEMQQYIPAKYNSNTELTADVTSSTTRNFELKAD